LIHSLPVPVPAAGEVLIATNTAVGARIRRFSVGDAVYAAGFPNPLEGVRLAYPNGAVEPAPKTRRVVHGAWEANLFISNVLDKPQPESGWPRGTDPCRDAHHSPGDLGEGNSDQNFHPRASR
jgi:hypothetical protein